MNEDQEEFLTLCKQAMEQGIACSLTEDGGCYYIHNPYINTSMEFCDPVEAFAFLIGAEVVEK